MKIKQMMLSKKGIKIIIDLLSKELDNVYWYGSFDSLHYFIDLLHLKQYFEKEVNLNAKKIK